MIDYDGTREVTAEEIQSAVHEAGIDFVYLRDCSLCGTPNGWRIIDDVPHYDSNCGCVSYFSPYQPRSWEDIASTINMQSTPEIRLKVARRMGLVAQPVVS